MGKVIVAVLATCAVLGILFHLFGNNVFSQTAVTVPGTAHTSPFGITWTLVVGGVIGFAVWRIVKGK